jgi:uncharacterized membrane protein YdbT with pleckstrin-like domain
MNQPGTAIAPVAPQPLATEEVLFEGSPALIPGVGALLFAILTAGLGIIALWWMRGGTSYKVTTQRVIVDRGLFGKTLDQLDIYRINDFVVERPFSQRIMGTGNIRLKTLDHSSPEVVLSALSTDVLALYERMRAAVELAKDRRNVRLIENEGPHPGG